MLLSELDRFKTQKKCTEVVLCDPKMLGYVPDGFNPHEMLDETADMDQWLLKFLFFSTK